MIFEFLTRARTGSAPQRPRRVDGPGRCHRILEGLKSSFRKCEMIRLNCEEHKNDLIVIEYALHSILAGVVQPSGAGWSDIKIDIITPRQRGGQLQLHCGETSVTSAADLRGTCRCLHWRQGHFFLCISLRKSVTRWHSFGEAYV
ncbi:hypothetical protein EVAR_7043_1 [Eumeta japonica]|uniref:Uncharacterized protein n=1 Tax=Eumeta variegata TaxID=151549 RepID=A0A4C1YPG1_EUMVA|nr:hypothetical protein EVAR_7043_1 [Eumeta japonica]